MLQAALLAPSSLALRDQSLGLWLPGKSWVPALAQMAGRSALPQTPSHCFTCILHRVFCISIALHKSPLAPPVRLGPVQAWITINKLPCTHGCLASYAPGLHTHSNRVMAALEPSLQCSRPSQCSHSGSQSHDLCGLQLRCESVHA